MTRKGKFGYKPPRGFSPKIGWGPKIVAAGWAGSTAGVMMAPSLGILSFAAGGVGGLAGVGAIAVMSYKMKKQKKPPTKFVHFVGKYKTRY